MTKLSDDLFALQSLLRTAEIPAPAQKARIEALRAAIPPTILAHFFRQLAAGRRGITVVRNGVCGECHLRLSHALAYMLSRSDELLVCESCGAFIMLPPVETAATVAPMPVAAEVPRPRPRAARHRRSVAAA